MRTFFRALLLFTLPVTAAQAVPIASITPVFGYADTVLEYFDSGVGPLAGPYGGTLSGFPVPVTLDVVLGNDPGVADFLSLPTGSFVTVGFVDETVIDGAGDDIFIQEIGAGGEQADVYVSANLIDFVFLGTIFDNTTTSLDLADIAFTAAVQAIRIVGKDNGGGSPGFDVVNVQVLPGSIGPPPTIPEPATAFLMAAGLCALGARRRKPIDA